MTDVNKLREDTVREIPHRTNLDERITLALANRMIGQEYPNIGEILDIISPLINAHIEAAVREARIDELNRLIPESVFEMASMDHKAELIATFKEIHDRIAQLQDTKRGNDE